MERTKPVQSSVSNKDASKKCTTWFVLGNQLGKQFELFSAWRQGKGLVSNFPAESKNYLWCANEIMELRESFIFVLWKHSHSYPPPFSSCLTVPSFRPLSLPVKTTLQRPFPEHCYAKQKAMIKITATATGKALPDTPLNTILLGG